MPRKDKEEVVYEVWKKVDKQLRSLLDSGSTNAVMYSKSSIETREHFKRMEIEINTVKKEVHEVKEDVHDIKKVLRTKVISKEDMKGILAEHVLNLDKRYASKRIENWIYAVIGFCLTAMGTAIFALIFKQ